MEQSQNPDRAGAVNPPITPSANGAEETSQPQGSWLAQNFTLLLTVIGIIALILHYNGPSGLITWGLVALGLGFVIFIHELGHFLAAKWCDVHVTTFSIGFGPALPGCSFQKGETTYKIAALPLGGFVNMVGEGPEADENEDYPRSFKNKTVGQRMLIISAGVIMNVLLGFICFAIVYLYHGVDRPPAVVWRLDAGSPAYQAGVRTGTQITRIGSNERPYFDDLRMRVALSGVGESIRFVFAPRAGGRATLDALIEPRKSANDKVPVIGIAQPEKLQFPPTVAMKRRSAPVAFHSAAAAGRVVTLKPGDRLVAATDPENPSQLTPLGNDSRGALAELGRRMSALEDKPLTIEVQRAGAGETVKIDVPAAGFEFDDKIVGTSDPSATDTLTVSELPLDPLDDTGKARDAFEFRRRIKQMADRPIVIQVQRKDDLVNILVPPAYHWSLAGLRMKMGPVSAIRKGSPAETAGVQAGDLISEIKLLDADGKTLDAFSNPDPVRLPSELTRRAAREADAAKLQVQITVLRPNPGRHRELERQVLPTVRWDPEWNDNEEAPVGRASPLSIPQLGLAYQIESVIASVEKGSPADKAGLMDNDRIDSVRFPRVSPTGELTWGKRWTELKSKREGNPEAYDQWAHLYWILQTAESPELEVKITRNNAQLADPIKLTAQRDTTWPLDDRGLILIADTRRQQAHSLGEALTFGLNRTGSFIVQIYLNLKGLFTGRIDADTLGGPIEIASQAFGAAGEDIWLFLLFLGIISVNLAVVNFLPIPVLDGGHMVFLIYEKLRGRPASELVRTAATYVGLALLASLMIFVFYLDIVRRLS